MGLYLFSAFIFWQKLWGESRLALRLPCLPLCPSGGRGAVRDKDVFALILAVLQCNRSAGESSWGNCAVMGGYWECESEKFFQL